MILSTKYEVQKSVQLEIVYDDETSKFVEIGVNDEVQIIYNKDGLRSTVTGRVAGIDNDPHVKPYPHEDFWRHPVYRGPHPKYFPPTCWIFIDASVEGNSLVVRVDARQIIDVTMIRKYNEGRGISTPDDETAIYAMRYKNNQFQITQDGANWITIGTGTPEGGSDMPTTVDELKDLIKEVLEEMKPDHPHHHHHCDCDEEVINKLIDLISDLTTSKTPDDEDIVDDPQQPGA